MLGARFCVQVNDLQPDTVYQFRFAARNSMGDSGFSFPSQRAKTNSIRIPHAFDPPQVFRVRGVTATLQIVLPPQPEGSSPLTTLHVDTRDALKKTAPLIRSQLMIAFDDKYVIEPLRPGGSYQFRVRGESVQGKGPQSQWSETVVIPMEKVSRANK